MKGTEDASPVEHEPAESAQVKEEIAALVGRVQFSLEKPASVRLLAKRLAFYGRHDDPAELVEKADVDPLSYWVARHLASAYVDLDGEMPHALRKICRTRAGR